jgi:hypothetical protein
VLFDRIESEGLNVVPCVYTTATKYGTKRGPAILVWLPEKVG